MAFLQYLASARIHAPYSWGIQSKDMYYTVDTAGGLLTEAAREGIQDNQTYLTIGCQLGVS